MSPGPNVAHRAWHRRGHGVLRQIDEASQIKDGDTNIAHARTSDVNLRKSVSGQDGVIIAKEGNRGLAHTGLKIETIILDSTRTYSLMIDPGCEHSLVPREHVTKLDEIVKDAAGEKSKFERGLVKVLRSNVYGNGRVIWRLEFVDKEHGFNCGGLKHDEICRKLNIASFHELICAGQSSQADSTPALSLNNETLSSEEPVEPNKQRRVAASFDKELAIHNERPDCVTGTGKVIIAKDHSVPRMNSMYYAPDQDKVSISNGATAAVECEHVASEPRSCKIFLPDSQLPILLSLVQKSLEAFRPGDSKPEIGYLALKLGIWLCKTQRRAIELRCDDINGVSLLRYLANNCINTEVRHANTTLSRLLRSAPRRINASRAMRRRRGLYAKRIASESRAFTGRALLVAQKQFASLERIHINVRGDSHVCSMESTLAEPLVRHTTTTHNEQGDGIWKSPRNRSTSLCADNSQTNCWTRQDTRGRAGRNVQSSLEGIRNMVFVAAPMIGMIYSRGSWPLPL